MRTPAKKGKCETRVAKRRGGNPTLRTAVLIERLLVCLDGGGTVSGFCREPHTPNVRTIENWAAGDGELRADIARARTRGCDMMEQEYDDVSKTPEMVTVNNGKKKARVVHPDDVAHRKLRLHALENRLKWNRPDKYGAKTHVEQTVDVTVQLSDVERDVRIRELLDKATVPVVEVDVGEAKEASRV